MATCIICAEAAVAGSDRSCMPSFNLGILAGQMLLLNMFGAPEILGLVGGTAGFLVAAAPEYLDLRRNKLVLGFAALNMIVVFIIADMRAGLVGFLLFVGLVVAGALIGYCIRKLEEARRFWLPTAILLALTIGVMIFSFGHYGQNDCWP